MSTRLEQEVWTLERCCGCGNCVALCSKGMLVWDAGESPSLKKREKALGLSRTTLDSCSFCQKFCEAACPRLEEEWAPLPSQRLVSVRTRGIVRSGEPNEVIKHLLVAALSSGLIDGALLPDLDPWELRPVSRLATTVGEIVDTLGASYLWAPPLSALNQAVYDQGLTALAVVGTPCTGQALRKLRGADNPRLAPYRDAVRLSIATFCTSVYLPELVDGFLRDEMGIAPHEVKRVQAVPSRDLLTVQTWDGATRTVPLDSVAGYTRHGCARCDDYLGESADLAVGTAGAPEGACTVVVRSQAGEICLRCALGMGLLEISGEVDGAVLDRAAAEKDRRKRAQAFDELMVLMLDALADPRQRAEVKQAFVRLYENKGAAELRREESNCYVTCGQC